MAMNVPSRPGTTRSAPAVPSGSSSQWKRSSSPLGQRRGLREVDLDQLAEVARRTGRPASTPAARELAQDVLEDRPVADRHERLGQDVVYGRSRVPEPAGEDHGSHMTYWPTRKRAALRSIHSIVRARPVAQVDLRAPSRSARGASAGSEMQPLHLAAWPGARAPRRARPQLRPSSSPTMLDDVADRDVVAGPELHRPARRPPARAAAARKPATVSVDVREVAPRVERAEPQRVAGQRLGDDRRDHRARGLVRPVGVERPHDRRRQPVAAVAARPSACRPPTLLAAYGDCGSSGCVLGDRHRCARSRRPRSSRCARRAATPASQRRLRDVERAERRSSRRSRAG